MYHDGAPIRISGIDKSNEKLSALQMLARKLVGDGQGQLMQQLKLLHDRAIGGDEHWVDRERLLLLVNSYEQAEVVAVTLRNAWPSERDRIYYLGRSRQSEDDFLTDVNQEPSLGVVLSADIETFALNTNGRILVAPMNAIGRGYNILNKNANIAAFGAVYFLIRPYAHPNDMTALARELNRRTLDWAADSDFSAWQAPTHQECFDNLRRTSATYWNDAQKRDYWRSLVDDEATRCEPKKDLAAYSAGLLVQAVGRLLRGGVPFDAFFIDAAFAMRAAKHPEGMPLTNLKRDAPTNSLLAAMIVLMRDLVNEDEIAKALYEPLANALLDTNFQNEPFPFDDYWTEKAKK